MSAGILVPSLFCLLTLFSDGTSFGPRPPNRQCSRCGTDNRGFCFGAYLCCQDRRVCFGGAEVRQSCQPESIYRTPCQDPNRSCGGRCKDTGFCCNNDICISDVRCYRDK